MDRIRNLLCAASIVVGLAASVAASDHPIGGDLLQLRDATDTRRRQVKFNAARDAAIAPSTTSDPRIVGATLAITGGAPGDGSSGVLTLTPSLWTGLGSPAGSKGFKYTDRAATTGVRTVTIKSGANGGSLVVNGRGSNWPYAITQPQGPIDVRFTIGSEVYCAHFTTYSRNEAGRVSAHKAPAPATCGGPAVCGNRVREGSEACDDGNQVSNDGCSATCTLEDASALCSGVATVSGTALDTSLVASGLASPTHITAPHLDTHRVFVVEQAGRIRIIKDGALLPTPFLAIESKLSSGSERGLLGLAFHPDFATNGRFFVDYTNSSGNTVIARYQVGTSLDDADESSEKILLTITQPYANHNGGQVAFGPDGYLYVGMGDGGSAGDPQGNGQKNTTLLGKLLRLDVNVDTPPYYAVPATNPNAGGGMPLGLIWAKGLRNPWRFSFDRSTGDLYIADVGQNQWEEIHVQVAASSGGENYGWNIFEGTHCFRPPSPATTCPSPPTGFTMPVIEYSHDEGCSITGGFVYRGCRMPDLRGTYFYADYCTAFIRTFKFAAGSAQNQADRTTDLAPGGGRSIRDITSFGEDAQGELYIADQDGEIYKIVPGSS